LVDLQTRLGGVISDELSSLLVVVICSLSDDEVKSLTLDADVVTLTLPHKHIIAIHITQRLPIS